MSVVVTGMTEALGLCLARLEGHLAGRLHARRMLPVPLPGPPPLLPGPPPL
jgi:hypothetical protein